MTNSTAGNAPVVAFTVLNNAKQAVPLSALRSISFTIAGPTTDYGYTSFGSNVTTPGYVTESAAGAACDGNGNCTYSFTHAVPAKATGTYAIGVEARRSETVLAGSPAQQTIQYGAPNKVVYFSVDGSAVADRRTVVQVGNCNQCHVSLQLHGALRNNTEYCVLCHNPSNTDASTRASATVAADKAAPPQGVDFNLLVHRIHYGINMQAANRTYIVVGFGGSHNDFSSTLSPALSPTGTARDTENCSLCHVNGSDQNLPLGKNLVVDPQGPVNPNPAISSACSGCHVDLPAASHMLSNTSSLYSDIGYLDPEFLAPEQSIYRDNSHTATALFTANLPRYSALTPKLTGGGSLFISSGSRPTNYYRPYAKLLLPIRKNLSWFTEWTYYGYAEAFYSYEGFRTHLVMTGLRFTR